MGTVNTQIASSLQRRDKRGGLPSDLYFGFEQQAFSFSAIPISIDLYKAGLDVHGLVLATKFQGFG